MAAATITQRQRRVQAAYHLQLSDARLRIWNFYLCIIIVVLLQLPCHGGEVLDTVNHPRRSRNGLSEFRFEGGGGAADDSSNNIAKGAVEKEGGGIALSVEGGKTNGDHAEELLLLGRESEEPLQLLHDKNSAVPLDPQRPANSGLGRNAMVIIFCVVAFVANGGFLIYVFWVM